MTLDSIDKKLLSLLQTDSKDNRIVFEIESVRYRSV
jgi:DNA-binding Lrp family transcriptional regulator